MPITYPLTVTVANIGINAGPFNLYSNLDLANPLATGVTTAQLQAGYTINDIGIVYSGTTSIYVIAANNCPPTPLIIPVSLIRTTSTTTSTTSARITPTIILSWSIFGGGAGQVKIYSGTNASGNPLAQGSTSTTQGRNIDRNGIASPVKTTPVFIQATPMLGPKQNLDPNASPKNVIYPLSLRVCLFNGSTWEELYYQGSTINTSLLNYTISTSDLQRVVQPGITVTVASNGTTNPSCGGNSI